MNIILFLARSFFGYLVFIMKIHNNIIFSLCLSVASVANYPFPFLARIFGSLCHSGLDPESILSCPSCKFVVVSLCLSVASVANYTFPLLARNFGAAQGVCLPDTGYVLSYIEDVRTGKNNAVITRNNR